VNRPYASISLDVDLDVDLDLDLDLLCQPGNPQQPLSSESCCLFRQV